MTEDLALNTECRRKGLFGGLGDDIDDSLLFFFLILVILFTNCGGIGGIGGIDDSLLFFFLLLVLIFCGDFFC